MFYCTVTCITHTCPTPQNNNYYPVTCSHWRTQTCRECWETKELEGP